VEMENVAGLPWKLEKSCGIAGRIKLYLIFMQDFKQQKVNPRATFSSAITCSDITYMDYILLLARLHIV